MRSLIFLLLSLTFVTPAWAGSVVLQDPSGDDFGPGKYKYPTGSEYKRGSFDLRKLEIKDKGSKVEFRISFAQRIEDPFDSKSWEPKGNGFSVQLVQIYLDLKAGSGFKKALPGVNAKFAAKDAWDKVILVAPQNIIQAKARVRQDAGSMTRSVIVPRSIKVRGKTLVLSVKKSALGGALPAQFGVQAVVGSSEGFSGPKELYSRKVNEYPGKHRFGGGSDYKCDPHLIDILAGKGAGGRDEVAAQKASLSYKCGPNGKSIKTATLPMVRVSAP